MLQLRIIIAVDFSVGRRRETLWMSRQFTGRATYGQTTVESPMSLIVVSTPYVANISTAGKSCRSYSSLQAGLSMTAHPAKPIEYHTPRVRSRTSACRNFEALLYKQAHSSRRSFSWTKTNVFERRIHVVNVIDHVDVSWQPLKKTCPS